MTAVNTNNTAGAKRSPLAAAADAFFSTRDPPTSGQRFTVDQDRNDNSAKRSPDQDRTNAVRCSATILQTARIFSQKSRLVNRIAVAGIAIMMFLQGNLLLKSHNSIGPQKEDDYFIAPNLKHKPYNISQLPGLWKASQFTGMNSGTSQKKVIVVFHIVISLYTGCKTT
jgi:hypothetical protein